MAISLFGTTELVYVQQHLPNLPDGFWRDLYPRVITTDREEVMFEIADIDNRKLAPFVAPNVQGRVMRSQGSSVRSLRPAYLKPKHVVDPTKAIPRRMGEPLLGGSSQAARFEAAVVDNLRLETEAIQRRWDWMAARATIDGSVVIVGDDYPSVTVDFGRDASLTVQLTSTAVWSATATAAPLTNLADLVDASFSLGNGPITRLVFGTTAWRNFIKNAAVLDLLNTLKRGSTSDFAPTPLTQNSNNQFMGAIETPAGRFDLFRYHNYYSEVSSLGVLTTRQFLDPTVVVGLGPLMEGTALFGAIQDVDAGFRVETTIFPKIWKNDDPSVVYTMSQSAPIFAPMNPNNTFKLITE